MIPQFHTQNVILLDYGTKTVMLCRWATQFCVKWKGWVTCFLTGSDPTLLYILSSPKERLATSPYNGYWGERDRLSAYDAIR